MAKITMPKIFRALEFPCSCIMDLLLTAHNRKPAATGSRIPLTNCANWMIRKGLMPTDEKMVPVTNISIHVVLNFHDVEPSFQLKLSLATRAAANGAVIAEDSPAANRPKPIRYFEKLPNTGCRLIARCVAVFISELFVAAAQIIIDIDIIPPIRTATTVSILAFFSSETLDHFCFTSETKFRLTGETKLWVRM